MLTRRQANRLRGLMSALVEAERHFGHLLEVGFDSQELQCAEDEAKMARGKMLEFIREVTA